MVGPQHQPSSCALLILSRYLPAMAAVAIGMLFIPEDFFDEPTKRTVTLGEANRRINFGIAYQLDEHNRRANRNFQPSLDERNWAMLDSYGGRSSLEDMEKVIAGYEGDATHPIGQHEKNLILEEAYGERSDLSHLRRAMEMYEVQ